MIAKLDVPHNTEMEKRFIENIGTFSDCTLSRKELLIGYLKASHKPKDWGSVNKDEVIAFVNQQLTGSASATGASGSIQ